MPNQLLNFIDEQKLDFHLGSAVYNICTAKGEGVLDKLLIAQKHIEHYIATAEMASLVKKATDACMRVSCSGACRYCPISAEACASDCKTCREYIEQNPRRGLDLLGDKL